MNERLVLAQVLHIHFPSRVTSVLWTEVIPINSSSVFYSPLGPTAGATIARLLTEEAARLKVTLPRSRRQLLLSQFMEEMCPLLSRPRGSSFYYPESQSIKKD